MKECIYCGLSFESEFPQRKYCSKECQRKDHYRNNKKYYLNKAIKWNYNNEEKRKIIAKKSFKKFIKYNQERFNELMLKNYYKDKDK